MSDRKAHRTSSGGFTLLEVMIALAFLAIALVGLITLHRDALRRVLLRPVDPRPLALFRVALAALLLERPQHLSAEQLYGRARAAGLRVSKATVYNTLGLLARLGLVREVVVDRALTGTRLVRLGIPDQFVEHGSRSELLRRIGLSPETIAERCRREHVQASL